MIICTTCKNDVKSGEVNSMKKLIFLLLLSCMGALLLSGCSWMGRTSGKAVATVEGGAENLSKGYKQGYKEKRAEDNPRPIPRDPDEDDETGI